MYRGTHAVVDDSETIGYGVRYKVKIGRNNEHAYLQFAHRLRSLMFIVIAQE